MFDGWVLVFSSFSCFALRWRPPRPWRPRQLGCSAAGLPHPQQPHCSSLVACCLVATSASAGGASFFIFLFSFAMSSLCKLLLPLSICSGSCSSLSFCHVVFVLCCRLHVYMDDGNSICDHDLMFCFAFSDSKKLKTLRDPPPSERCSYTVFFFFFLMAPSKKSNKMPRAVQATVEDASYASGELWPSPANSSVAWLAGESPPLLAASSAVPPPPLPAASSAVPPPLSPAASLAVPPPLSPADSPPPLPPPPLGPEEEDLLDAAADKELEWSVHFFTMLQDRCH